MSLPAPVLDNRRFQDIVDEAKAAIPRHCPEWTDHNVSDPGVALIELFAWMTDMLLYRVNQVPDKLYVKFLELIGIRLDPPRPARAPVTLYLSAPQPTDLTIPEGTEVATIRTETSPAIIFSTEADLTIRYPKLATVLTRGGEPDATWVPHDVRRLEFAEHQIPAFSPSPRAGDALYLGLERDHSQHVLAVHLTCDVAAGAGVDPSDAPLVWEAWQGSDAGWGACEIEFDGTRALNVPGQVILHTPRMQEGVLAAQTGYWLRCMVTRPARAEQKGYYAPPMVSQLRVESLGGTVAARHAVTVCDEVVGRSDGRAGQTFRLLNSPVLARDPRRDYLVVEPPLGEPEQVWTEVADFADSGDNDRHYTLDSLTGEIMFGPSLLQPDGKMYSFGAVPQKNSKLRMARYQYGGGVIGNAPRGALSVMKSSIPYVARVTNRQPATQGLDAQSLEDAKLRAPQELRSRARAVTADDYEHIASRMDGVARAYCLTPGAQSGNPHAPKPGHVGVLILPGVSRTDGLISPDELVPAPELLQRVRERLDQQRLIGTTLDVRAPQFVWVSVSVTLHVAERTDPAVMEDVRAQAEAALYRYLNPYTGGPQGSGWPLGRDLNRSELFGLLQQIPLVEYADRLRVTSAEAFFEAGGTAASQHLAVPFDALVASGHHQVKVAFAIDEG